MKVIVLNMNRLPIAQELERKLRLIEGIRVIQEDDYDNISHTISENSGNLCLMEVMENVSGHIDYCLNICKKIRSSSPGCKLMLFLSEGEKADIKKIIKAKQVGEIHDFVFFDTSFNYLITKIESMWS